MSQPVPIGFQLKAKVTELEETLTSRHPRMPQLLQEIWKALREQPENVTLMTEEEIRTVVNGLKVQTGVEFAANAVKGTAAKTATAKIKQLGLNAF